MHNHEEKCAIKTDSYKVAIIIKNIYKQVQTEKPETRKVGSSHNDDVNCNGIVIETKKNVLYNLILGKNVNLKCKDFYQRTQFQYFPKNEGYKHQQKIIRLLFLNRKELQLRQIKLMLSKNDDLTLN